MANATAVQLASTTRLLLEPLPHVWLARQLLVLLTSSLPSLALPLLITCASVRWLLTTVTHLLSLQGVPRRYLPN